MSSEQHKDLHSNDIVLDERKKHIVQLGEEIGVVHAAASTNVKFKIENFEFEKVMASTTLIASLKERIGKAIADSTQLSPESMIVQFSPGSGVASVQICCLNVHQAEHIKGKISVDPDAFLQNLEKFVTKVPEFANAAADVKDVLHFGSLRMSTSVTMEQATQTEDKLKIWDISKSLEKADYVINSCRQLIDAHEEILGGNQGEPDSNLEHHVHKSLSEPKTFKRMMNSWNKHLKSIELLVSHVRKDVEAADKAKTHEIGRLKQQLSRHESIDISEMDGFEDKDKEEPANGLKEAGPKQPHSSVTHNLEALHFSEDALELKDIMHEAANGDWGRLRHRVDFLEYFFLFVWLLLLLGLWRWQRFLCWLGLPEDCDMDKELYQNLSDHEFMVAGGFFLAIMTGMNEKSKFLYIFSFGKSRLFRVPRALIFLAFMFATPPIWSVLGSVPFLESFSLTTGGVHGASFVLAAAVLILLVVLVIWHVYIGFKYNTAFSFIAYVLSRTIVIGFYIVYLTLLAVSAEEQGAEFHVHHYIIGWIFASFAEFSHPVSMILLAIGTGIYVQGIACYGPDPYLYEKDQRITIEKLGGVSYQSPPMSDELRTFFMKHCF